MIEYFDKVSYNGISLTNLTQRVVDIKQRLYLYDIYYNYTIKDGERPDTIAYDYYNSSDYAWLILIVNDIYDPYLQWPLTQNQFLGYMRKKYGEDFYTQKSVVAFYTNPDPDKNYRMTQETYNNITPEERMGWVSTSVYDDEEERNEAKRNIKLISNRFVAQIDKEMQELFS